MTKMTRRSFGILAGSTILATTLPAIAQARGRTVVGTWGGDYQRLQQENIVEAELADAGLQVVFDPAAEPVRKAKLLAERRLPRGSMDVACLTRNGTYEMFINGALEELDETKIPNLANVHPFLRTKYSIPHMYTGRVILYNPTAVSPAPTSYEDLWDPKYAGKVGVIDIQYQSTIESAAMIAGGSPSNLEPGKAKLMELKKQGVKIYPTNEAMAQALKTGEVVMCIMWAARGYMWKSAGIDIDIAVPKEGLALYISDVAIPKNAPNKQAAFAYVNAMLAADPQAAFAKTMGYAPTVENVSLAPELAALIDYTPEQQKDFVLPDLDVMAKADADLQSWWEKEFKA